MSISIPPAEATSEDALRATVIARFFQGLSDPTRVRILDLLLDEGELNVSEIVDRLDQPQGRVSSHLACLRWCGFVTAERSGRYVRYRIADEHVRQILEHARHMIAGSAEQIMSCTRL